MDSEKILKSKGKVLLTGAGFTHHKTAAELNALLPSILDKAFKGEL